MGGSGDQVYRTSAPDGRRRVRLVLTPRGRDLERVIDGEMHVLTERALSEDERTSLTAALVAIRDNLLDREERQT